MKEDFLHYLWKYKKYAFAKAQTTSGAPITLVAVGQHNQLSGPDFFNASLYIEEQLWAGNVEIHSKSSDWYAHNHEKDPAYDNVILHVVWEHDVEIYRKNNEVIPTLVLKDYVSQQALSNYKKLFEHQSQKWINCEAHIKSVPAMIQDNWLERLYFERLARKTQLIKPILKKVNNDWEATLFIMLLKGFGTKVNASAFQSIGEKVPFAVVRKCAQDPFTLEALLLGAGALLPDSTVDSYPMQLQGEFDFIKHKYGLDITGIMPVQFFKLRPDNFPTIRLSQIAQLYFKTPSLLSKVMAATTIEDLYNLFDIQASVYWDTHYSFGTGQKKRVKKLSKPFVAILLINAVLPLRFYYAQYLGKEEGELLLKMIQELKPEKNSIIKKFDLIRQKSKNAQESQALLELKSQYCDVNKCLSCGIGNYLISNS